MPEARHYGITTGVKPGGRDAPADRPPKRFSDETRIKADQAARTARRANRAYGTLDLDIWTEHLSFEASTLLGRPPQRRTEASDDE